ncbi:MAG: redox-regulated ATPase YchF [Chloroflexi bacterium]|nr:redox-regulated ATPase YchF [Chloroflexota bacterium]
MEIAIIGFPNSSKTTIFNALTRGQVETTAVPSAKLEVHTAVVQVPDPRVDALSTMFRPRKTTYARVTYNDIAGMARGMSRQSGFSGGLLNLLSSSEALMHVVRAFQDDTVPSEKGVDPTRDIADMDTELMLADLAVVEKKVERLGKERKDNRDELTLFARLQAALEEGQPLRDLEFTPDEAKSLRGYGFLSLKPMLLVLNVGDAAEAAAQIPAYDHRQSLLLTLHGRLEAEIAQLDSEEAQAFLQEYGIAEPTLNRVIRASYDLLGLQSFFTVGEDEVRAWTVRRGATAVEAAGAIHTDLARGFIRAEVVAYDDMVACGSLVEVRARGLLRLAKRDYIVQDGDILNIRFAV